MLDRGDCAALDALSDALADAASVHRSAAKVADDARLGSALAARADRLDSISADVRGNTGGEAGSVLALLDRLKLAVDRAFGDDDAAADAAGRDAEAGLLTLIDGYLNSPELSAEIRPVFEVVRERLTTGRASPSDTQGLKDLPS